MCRPVGGFAAVQVAVDVYRGRRHPPQRQMAQRERRVRRAQRGYVLLGESGVVQGLGVEVMVAEDEQALAGAAAYVEHQAPIAPGVRVGDVAQADDGVAGPYAAAPFAQQVVVHLLDVGERPVPVLNRTDRSSKCRSGPDPGPLGRRLDDRDRRSLHRSGQLRLGAGTGTGVGGGLKLEIGFPEVPEGLGLQQWLFGHRDLANVCGDFYLGS